MNVDMFPNVPNSLFRYDPLSSDHLKPLAEIWFQFLLKNIHPRGEDLDKVFPMDMCLLYCLRKSIPIHLSSLIFNHLKLSILASKNSQKSFIPYGRVLSELFELAGMIEIVQRKDRKSVV